MPKTISDLTLANKKLSSKNLTLLSLFNIKKVKTIILYQEIPCTADPWPGSLVALIYLRSTSGQWPSATHTINFEPILVANI